MNSLKMTKMEQVLLVVATAVIAMFFFMKKAHDPLTLEIGKLAEQNNELVTRVSELKNNPVSTRHILDAINDLKAEIDQLETEYREVEAHLLTPDNKIEEAVMTINEKAANNALSVDILAPVAAEKTDLPPVMRNWQKRFSRHVYEIKLSGLFPDFLAFAKEIVELERLVSMTNLNIEKQDDSGRVAVRLLLMI